MAESPVVSNAAAFRTDVDDALERLWRASEHQFRERVERCEDYVVALLRGSPTEEARDAALIAAHKLAGTMGMFGMAAGSTLARELEMLVESTDEPELRHLDRMSTIVVELGDQLEARVGRNEQPAETRSGPTVEAEPTVRLELVGEETAFLESLRWAASARGMAFEPADSADVAASTDVIVVSSRVMTDVAAMVAEATGRGLPVVVITESTGIGDRAGIVGAGASAVLAPSTPIDVVLDLVEDLVAGPNDTLSILAVGIEGRAWEELLDGLASHGCTARAVSLDDLGPAIESGTPDALLIGSDLGGMTVADTVAAVAADPQWSAPMVVAFPTTIEQPDRLTAELLAGGADDVVDAAAGVADVARRIRLRAARARRRGLRSTASRGGRDHVSDRIRAHLANSDEQDPCSVLYFRSRHLDTINQQDGYSAGDRHLQSIERFVRTTFRSADAVGTWLGGTIAVITADREAATRRLRDALADLERAGLSCHGGVATAPIDGTDPDTVVRAAARRTPGSPHPATESAVDAPRRVVVVEDDPIVARLVADLLESEGRRVEVVEDGPTAVSILSRPDIHLEVALVLLDITLPGIDGFGVLRAMARANVLGHIPVVMLTARALDGEVETALELGAVDHVAKPFSPQVLLRRVERALTLAAA